MGNVTSSLKAGNLESLANTIDEARSNPSAILDSLYTQGRKLALSLLGAINDTKQDPSAVLDSLYAHGRNIAALLSNTAVGAGPLIENSLDSLRRHWHKVVALLPISRMSLYSALFSITINYLQRKRSSHSLLPGGYHLLLLLSFYTSLEGLVGPEFVGVSSYS
jgi:hypothetical protein